MRTTWFACFLLSCATGDVTGPHDPDHDPGDDPADPADPGDPGWDCAESNGAMECTRSADPDVHYSYTCTTGEEICPPSGSAETDDWACISGHGTTTCREVVENQTMPAMRPTDCAVDSWKVYFCQLAEAKLAAYGYDYTFQCDALQDTIEISPLPNGDCNDLVGELEIESWTEAAFANCAGALSQEITAWCYNTNLQLSRANACVE